MRAREREPVSQLEQQLWVCSISSFRAYTRYKQGSGIGNNPQVFQEGEGGINYIFWQLIQYIQKKEVKFHFKISSLCVLEVFILMF